MRYISWYNEVKQQGGIYGNCHKLRTESPRKSSSEFTTQGNGCRINCTNYEADGGAGAAVKATVEAG
ncbi:MAG: hypothetical protein PUP93_32480 [Rhizonema sp. NSF051]|nr:hypothetical protein [Rhizonema sp. NSF051]